MIQKVHYFFLLFGIFLIADLRSAKEIQRWIILNCIFFQRQRMCCLQKRQKRNRQKPRNAHIA